METRKTGQRGWLHQISAGGVVFRNSSLERRICLIARKKANRLIWCLPKGHVEKDEKIKEAALREVREETGITGSILSSLGSIQYVFYDLESKKNVSKTVHFFLVEYQEGKLTDHDDEVELAKWFSASEALKHAEYKGEREVLNKALKKLSNLDEQRNSIS